MVYVCGLYITRDLFPLAGSMGSDAQGLPAGSSSLNCCARCLFAVRYLPEAGILVNGLLALFQSTSIEFLYQWVKDLTLAVEHNLDLVAGSDKVETIGKSEGNVEVTNRLLDVIRNSRDKISGCDPNTTMNMFLYSNNSIN